MASTMRAPFHNEPSLDFSVEENRAAMREALRASVSSWAALPAGDRRRAARDRRVDHLDQPRQPRSGRRRGRRRRARPTSRTPSPPRPPPSRPGGKIPAKGAPASSSRWRRSSGGAGWSWPPGWSTSSTRRGTRPKARSAEAIDFLEWYGRQALKLAEPVELAHLQDEANELPLPADRGRRGHPALELPLRHPDRDDDGAGRGRERGRAETRQQHAGDRLQDARDHGGGRGPGGGGQLPAGRRRRDRRSCWSITRRRALSPSPARRISASASTSARRRCSRVSAG